MAAVPAVLRAELAQEIVNPAGCGGTSTISFVDFLLDGSEGEGKPTHGRLDVPRGRTDVPRQGWPSAPNARQDVPNGRVRPGPGIDEGTRREETELIADSFRLAALGRLTVRILLDETACSTALGEPAAVANGVVVLPQEPPSADVQLSSSPQDGETESTALEPGPIDDQSGLVVKTEVAEEPETPAEIRPADPCVRQEVRQRRPADRAELPCPVGDGSAPLEEHHDARAGKKRRIR